MSAKRFGGKYSPGASRGSSAPAANPFRNRNASRVSIRARLMYLLPVPLLFAALGSIGRGNATEMLAELLGLVGLMTSAWLLNDGIRAENAFNARTVARPPSVPRKLFAAVLTGVSVCVVGWLSIGQPLPGAIVFGAVATAAQVLAFGLDPMKKKGLDGVNEFETERVAKAIDKAEGLVRQITGAASRIGDRRLEERIDRLCDQAREVFRVVEADPRDLSRARKFLSVYLLGLRDATTKFAEIYSRTGDPEPRKEYEALLADLETSFEAHRTDLLADDRTDLDVEIEVLRERLKQDGLTTE
ncbi:5-bromo-4-chloroindolyl phosphate hydrolysis family protein [Amaricoccus tamworthensis]|uniref:5-bromo-4-chloroindolyl phosphate hydrolysis family protein n=1 Tax=Amaricoccus tamworthensis TaxID=57002 RepID=UPI003C7B0D04